MDEKRFESRKGIKEMTDDFKRKLELYEKGQLEGEELVSFEEELAKLELYHDFLGENKQTEQPHLDERRQKGVLRRSKWKARLQTALTVLGLFFILAVVSSVITGAYYMWGSPSRVDVFRSVIDQTLTVTDPYGELGGTSSGSNIFFNMDMTRDLNKKVGKERFQVGELEIPFFFSLMGVPEIKTSHTESRNQPAFTYPGTDGHGMSDWERLEHLPEGTVVSTYVSFRELLSTADVFQYLSENDIDITWFAVDTGGTEEDDGVVWAPVGFPESPIWHEDDFTKTSHEQEGRGLFGKTVSESATSPEYKEGNTDILHEQFLKTLAFLKKHEKKANRLYNGGKLHLEKRIDYLETNGIKHYGVVATGPTREMLKLKDAEWISAIEIDEVGFWNWD